MSTLWEIDRRSWGVLQQRPPSREPAQPLRYRVEPLPAPLRHESANTAWGAAVAALVGWRRDQQASAESVLSQLDGPFRGLLDEGRGLSEREVTELLLVSDIARRRMERPGSPAQWDELLRRYGPLWALWPEKAHDRASLEGMLVVGIIGDGSPSRTRLLLLDLGQGRRHKVTVQRVAARMTAGGAAAQLLHLPAGARRGANVPEERPEPAPRESAPPQEEARVESLGRWVRAFEQPTLSAAGLDFIARHEGFRGSLYNDVGGHCTIGYGHLVHRGACDGSEPLEFRQGIQQARALELLRQDATAAEAAVRQAVQPPLTQAQLDALVSFTFNVGINAFRSSTLLTRINEGHIDKVPEQLRRWTHSGGRVVDGLRRRREAEVLLFTTGDYGAGARAQSWVQAASIPPAVVGSKETVLDRDARVRSGPPDFTATGQRLPQYSRVTITAVSADGQHVQVADENGADLGWTVRSNLGAFFKDDPALAATQLTPAAALTIDSGWPLQRRRLGELYNRLGGLFDAMARATNTGVPEALAVWWVESGGRRHVPNRTTIRFENHLLFRRWGQDHQDLYDAHFQHGGRGGVPGKAWQNHRFRAQQSDEWTAFQNNQTSTYEVLDFARNLAGEDVALQCISIGGPQILVSNYRTLGYASPRAMYDAFQADERWHVLGFYDYCQYHGGHLARRRYLLDHLRARRWVDFARGFNGPGKAQLYGGNIRAAFEVASALPFP